MIAEARPSAGVCLLRERGGRTEVLMVRRAGGATFMGGAWVFPGGAIDGADRGDDAAAALVAAPHAERPWLAAALRELVEEAGVWLSRPPRSLPTDDRPRGAEVFVRAVDPGPPLAPEGMVLFANWVTPTAVPVRFDARFYVTAVEPGIVAEPDGAEVVAAEWRNPAETIAAADAGALALPFPTRRTLRRFAELGDATAIVDYARSLPEVAPVRPRLRFLDYGEVEALLPDDPGYDDLPDDPPQAGMLERAVSVRSAAGEPIPELGPHPERQR